jgi:hypothetical protein
LNVPNAQTANQVQELVFAANFNHTGVGTTAQNKIDAQQAFFVDGVVQAARTLGGSASNVASSWYMMTDDGFGAYQGGAMSEFMIYTNTSNTTATDPSAFVGSAVNNSFTYAGESRLISIDGKAGYDTVVLSGAATNLDTTAVTLNSIELIHMQNGETNQLTINNAQLVANGSILSVLMDSSDSIVYESTTLNHSATQEMIVFGTVGNDIIDMSSFNELVYGRGGSDTFNYEAWSDAATSSSKDAITDFTMGSGADGDKLDLADLLDGYTSGSTLADFITLTDDSTDTSIAIDINGDSSGTDLTIVLTGATGKSLDDMISDGNLILL